MSTTAQQKFDQFGLKKKEEKMEREKISKNKHKAPKFRNIYDEDLDWQERMEIQHRNRKLTRKSHRRRTGSEIW